MPRRKKDQIDYQLQETTPEQAPEPQPIPTEQPQPEQPDEAATADVDETNFVNIEQKITAEEFAIKRSDLIDTYGGNNMIGTNTLNAMIADLLGFAQSGQKWKPYMRYTMKREDGSSNSVTFYMSPAGNITAKAVLTSDGLNDDMERELICVPDIDLTLPATAHVRKVQVYDHADDATNGIFNMVCDAVKGRAGFVTETLNWISDVFYDAVKPEPIEEGEDEPLPAAERQEEDTEAKDESAAPQYKPGEQTALDPEVFPTEQSLLTPEKSTILEKLNLVKAKLKFEEEDLKEIKTEQKNAFTSEINNKKQNIEMLERLGNYFEILEAVADAKVQSALSDCAFIVYTTPSSKGKWVHIGTGQNVLEAKITYGHGSVFEVASFEKGELAGAETGDYPTTQDAEIAHNEPQEGAKLAEEDKLPTVVIHDGWKCPHGEFEEILSAENANEARGRFECTTHEYCTGCEGPEFVGDIEVEGLNPTEVAGDELSDEDSDLPAAEPGTDESEEGAA